MKGSSFRARLSNPLRSVFFRCTGGRPMIDAGTAFTDVVSGQQAHYYRDRLGREWMADGGKWSLFRVKTVSSN